MPSYIVETYLTHRKASERLAREERARAAAAELTNEGVTVRLEFAIHIPEDEIHFLVFEAPSADQAALTAQRAGLDPTRLVEALTTERIDG